LFSFSNLEGDQMAIQMIVSKVGPLPITATFDAKGDSPMYLEINGSVWSQKANNMIGIAVKLDGNAVGTAQIFSNGTATHRTVVPTYIPVKLTQGKHTLTLSASSAGTVSDLNDFYTAVIHY
jgi:hypothetical protein